MGNALLKLYYDLGTLKKDDSLKNAPYFILKHISEIYSDFSLNHFKLDYKTFTFNSDSNIKEDLLRLEKHSNELIKNNDKILFLGGDHSISYATISAFKEYYANGKVIVFDAHPDVESDFFISHEDYLRILINESILKPEDVFLIGLRNASKEEIEFLKKKHIQYYNALEIQRDLEKIKDALNLFIKDVPIYLSIDNDVFDFGFATGYYEPLGINLFQFITLIESFKSRIKAFDIVEYYPSKDINEINAKNLASLIFYLFSQ